MLRRHLLVCLLFLLPSLATAQDSSSAAAPPKTPPVSVPSEIPQASEIPVAAAPMEATPASETSTPTAAAPATSPPAKTGKNAKKNPVANKPVVPVAAAPATPVADDGFSPSERYRRDMINFLTLRTDAPLLLAASIMARPDDNDPDRPHAFHSTTLLTRAQTAGPKDALTWWITAFACGNAIQICPRPDALQKLDQIAANNAAVWLLDAQRAQKAGDRTAANVALARAGAAREYNDYSTELTRTLLQAINDLPVPPALLEKPPQGVAATREGIQLTIAYNLASRLGPGAQPVIAAALELCDPTINAAQFDDRRKDCLALAGKLEWGSSLLAQRAGLALRARLQGSGDKPNTEIANKLRNLAWQEQRSTEITQGMLASADGTRQLQRLSLQSHTESGLVYALLREANVPLEAPLETTPETAPAADPTDKN
ncbi:hypothetical protein ELE36_01345 [Pseudolysobacter antarcticus]|uniref:Secreted protein n=1 Tax=Pseudolysobacter antarcticus TaxID=2511995 RepID=A0A411HFA6_9GAMM|nr:hypothetical protein [Pseudolysobacter antarcticus]QBB69134.1 hypothetical protein ELE36_01345 [Pseudolysobacter antarcticus]